LKNFLDVGFEASDSAKHAAQTLGFVTRLISISNAAATRRFDYIARVAEPAIAANQLKVYFNRRGEPVGFLVWAWLSPETEKSMIESAGIDLHPSEWREGNSLWLLDIVSPFNNTRKILRAFFEENMPLAKSLTYQRKVRDSLVVKRIAVE
jgi:hemolysin-activating ACP:hemolysin acyltransferase